MNRDVHEALRAARGQLPRDAVGLFGFGVAVFGDGETVIPFSNLVTTAGDQYYVRKSITGLPPAVPGGPTVISGMKLGTGTTAASKSGTGAALVTYLAGSNVALNTGYPQAVVASGTDQGWMAVYQSVWAAGVATSTALAEVVLVNDAGTNATSTAANTYARAVLSPLGNKGASQPLTITWYHTFLGA